jgi:hypothetical protein
VILDVYLLFSFICTESLTLVSDPTSRRFIRWLLLQTFIYIYIVVLGAEHKAKRLVLQCINGVSSNPVEGRTNIWQLIDLILTFNINLVSQVTLRSSGTDVLYGCHLLRCLYNKLYFLWLYNEFIITLYNILKIAELDCCQIIILSIYVPSTHA